MGQQDPNDGAGAPEGIHRAYLFEAKGIQRWILQGGRLRDIVAASNLLARAATSEKNDFLQPVLARAGFTPVFSRRAGGAFMLHYNASEPNVAAAFERFRALWRLVFMQIAPGLEFVESFGEGITAPEARKNAYSPRCQIRRTAGRENSAASLLPLGHPLAQLATRTGLPAIEVGEYMGTQVERRDSITVAKRRASEAGGALEEKFCPEGIELKALRWPTQMEDDGRNSSGIQFPFDGDEQWIAVMHADISALGKFYETIGNVAGRQTNAGKGFDLALDAAKIIEESLVAAARAATKETLLEISKKHRGVMPARPVLLGGDDITIILRGDVALPFTKIFLEKLELESERRLSQFAAGFEPQVRELIAIGLTATAGVAFGKAKQPFFRLLDLAKSLCDFAKSEAKAKITGARPASLFAFHRVTESALASDADDLLARFALRNGRSLTMQPYGVGTLASGFVPMMALEELKDSLLDEALKSGGLRELRSLLLQELDDQAQEAWRRWRDIALKRNPVVFGQFDKALLKASGQATKLDLVFADDGPNKGRTSLFDALEWRAVS